MGNGQSRRRSGQSTPGPVQYNYPQQVYPQQAQQAPGYNGSPTNYANGQFYGGYLSGQYGLQHPGQSYPQPSALPHLYGQPPVQEYQQTATIKNPVNLKKHMLRLLPYHGNSDLLCIHFTFDASSPCRVTTFVSATEDADNGSQLFPQPTDRAPVQYASGMGLLFPPDEGTALHHVIRISEHNPQQLMEYSNNTYPLIIRLEALTDEGRAEGRCLDDCEPGSALPMWVQAQTTYAMLQKDEDNSWRVIVLKQKIWVKNVSYELQEIYGMEQNRTANLVNGVVEDVEGRDCVICMNAERDTTVLPCRHMCMCSSCARTLKTQTNKCPICRNEISSLLHIKVLAKAPGNGDSPSTETQDVGASSVSPERESPCSDRPEWGEAGSKAVYA